MRALSRSSELPSCDPLARRAESPLTALRTASRATALAEQLRRFDGAAEPFRLPAAPVDGELARRTLERRIRAHLPRGYLSVSLTDNRHTMISVRREPKHGPRYSVRVHHMFVDADPAVTRALARYIAHNDARASRLLGEYIDAHQHRVRPRPRRAAVTQALVSAGEFFDLQVLYEVLNRDYFEGAIDAHITWGPRGRGPRRRNSIKMGSYSVEDRLIRIHRSLDRDFVPRYFVEWIVFHEMLHQVHDVPIVKGRRRFHTEAFLADESRFADYDRARAWERANLDRLLTF